MIYAIRHLPTQANLDRVMQGSQDNPILPITSELKQGIEQNLQALQSVNFDQVIVSGLKRTHQTALAYGITGYTVEPLIDEVDWGDCNGKGHAEFDSQFSTPWYTGPGIPGGESTDNLVTRIKKVLTKYDNKSILMFGHGSYIRALRSYSKYGTLEYLDEIKTPNNSITLI